MKTTAENSAAADPDCPACGHRLRPFRLLPAGRQRRCERCGLLNTPPASERDHASGIVQHFSSVDPHGAVAGSKTEFFAKALQRLRSQTKCRSNVLVDVGCGCGYFLEAAAALGWRTIGVDLAPEMISAARERVPTALFFSGDLRSARLQAASVDAITLWDVLEMVPDPAAELAECMRVLAPGGIIAIRTRNLVGQILLFRGYSGLGRLWRRIGIKPPFVFHRYTFTRAALEHLLAGTGFSAVACGNSPLTLGDAYAVSPLRGLAAVAKRCSGILFKAASRMTQGRLLIGPSLLAWARKERTSG